MSGYTRIENIPQSEPTTIKSHSKRQRLTKMLCQSKVQCVTILFFLSCSWGLVRTYSVGSREKPGSHNEDFSVSSKLNDNSLSSLQDLENKLDLILQGETREKDLLQDFLLNKQDEDMPSTTYSLHSSSSSSKMKRAESQSWRERDEAIITNPDLDPDPASSQHPPPPSSSSLVKQELKNVDDNEEERDKEGTTTHFNLREARQENGKQEASMLVKKLEENSKRMETMVIFLADLRNVLSQAVASQDKQVALRSEVAELREEIDYLRKEFQKIRTEPVQQHSSLEDPKMEHKIHNDETTIEWLKESLKEVRHGMEEVSSSVNVTGLVHLKQQWKEEVNRVDRDLRSLRNDVESLKVNQAKDDEAFLEIKGDIADLRTWHIKMGQKFLQQETQELITKSTETQENEWDSKVSETNMRKLTFLWNKPRTTKEEVKEQEGKVGKSRHQRKLKLELSKVENVIQDVVRDQTLLQKRVVNLEKKIVTGASQLESEGDRQVNLNHDIGETRLVNEINNNIIHEDNTHIEKMKMKKSLRRKIGEYGASNSYRINSLEQSLADYSNTLESLGDKVSSLQELRESSTQLFTALEALETKYDERLTEMQTGLARLEATVSSTSITNDELKEQQNLQSRVMQTVKKDVASTKDHVHTNHLRLAAVQSQLLKWGLRTCADQSAESIQNIKIAAIEAKIKTVSSS